MAVLGTAFAKQLPRLPEFEAGRIAGSSSISESGKPYGNQRSVLAVSTDEGLETVWGMTRRHVRFRPGVTIVPMALVPGTHIGPYEVQALLGIGGMGEVYRVRDTRLDRTAALKVLSPEKVADEERRRRFLQEAKAASALNHPHIVAIYDVHGSRRRFFW